MKPPINCIVFDTEGRMISVRTWVKVFFNPILRFFGYQFQSEVDSHNSVVYAVHHFAKLKRPVRNFIKQYRVALFDDWGMITWDTNINKYKTTFRKGRK